MQTTSKQDGIMSACIRADCLNISSYNNQFLK